MKIENVFTIEKIVAVLHQINDTLSTYTSTDSGLMCGDSGIRLFSYEYAKFFKTPFDDDQQSSILEELVALSYESESPTFCSGKSGVNWFFNYLSRAQVIAKDDLAFICDDSEKLASDALDLLLIKNYDYLHGATGIFYSLLYSGFEQEQFFRQFFHLINQLINESPGKNILPYFSMESYYLKTGEVNLSLSHGITSVLKFCMECIRMNVCQKEAKAVAKSIVDYLFFTHSDGTYGSYFTSIVNDSQEFAPSRLAWCYGDLTIGYSLLQYSHMFKDSKIRDLALKVLNHTRLRTNERNEIVSDAGICHGTAGIAYIYHKLSKVYHLSDFEKARDYWLAQTLQKIDGTEWRDGYKKYNGYLKTYENDHTLLEGSAGIGLVFLSVLSDEFEWDYLLMLS